VINKFIIIVIVQGEKTKIEKEKGKKGINLGRNEQQNGESGCAELCICGKPKARFVSDYNQLIGGNKR